MWGCILTDHVYQPNFSVGYTAMKSDAVVHLAQWQYWWWFWFSFLWAFYYLTVNRVVRHRVLKFRPKMYTSYRSHGKWGDFLACIIPGLWCINILTNSSFILRLMEWQNESSLFSVRIRARQWYWIYKFELRHIVDIASTPRNIGRNHWAVIFGGAYETSHDYSHALKLRNQNLWLARYWGEYMRLATKLANEANYGINSARPKLGPSLMESASTFNFDLDLEGEGAKFEFESNFSSPYSYESEDTMSQVDLTKLSFFKGEWIASPSHEFSNKLTPLFRKRSLIHSKKLTYLVENTIEDNFFAGLTKAKPVYFSRGVKVSLFEGTRQIKKVISEMQPIIVTATDFGSAPYTISDSPRSNFIPHFSKERSIAQKTAPENSFFVIKQKRYKVRNVIPARTLDDRPNLGQLSFINQLEFEPTKLYRSLKKNRNREEAMSSQLSRRLLRTRKTLVLPAHANLTLVTNSYDVVHSWFLPSLGIKMDCVPGRSTHHTFYVDNVGFFYGQCAEICGRYHHHMPIRVCMLPYEHFFVWWQHFGLPRVLNMPHKSRAESQTGLKTFSW